MKDWLELSRREFLAVLGATYGSAACALAAPESWFLEYARSGEDVPSERFVNTLCRMCPGGCGLKVRAVHGCAVGIRGNTEHPINRGGLCSRASAALQDFYNPDRLRSPLKRVGDRGSDQWQEVEWEEAIALTVQELRKIREAQHPEGLCVVIGMNRGLTRLGWQRLTRAYGSPNFVDAFPEENLQVLPAILATQGIRQRMGYDLANTSYVMSFSSGWLDSHWSSEQAARGFADFRRGRPGFRPRWVHAGPRMSLTAAKADEWIPIRPGTEGALALAIAHVIMREGLYDREFVERHGYGFEDWVDEEGTQHLGFRRCILQEYAPDKVVSITGVPEGTIFRIAREFSSARPALALGSDAGGCDRQSTSSRAAIHALNALVGSIDVPGGVTIFRELDLLDEPIPLDGMAKEGLAQPRLDGSVLTKRLADHAVDRIPEALESKAPYPVRAMILVDADPVYSLPDGKLFARGLKEIPFVVALTGYHNDSSRFADIILPTPHFLHCWDFDVAHSLAGHPVVTMGQPVVPLPPRMKDSYWVARQLAQGLEGDIAQCLPWGGSEEVVHALIDELFGAGKGAAFGPANEESWARLLESRGWRAPFAKTRDELRADILAGGGWTDPIYFHREWDRVFRSPPGKIAFSSATLAKSFQAHNEGLEAAEIDRRCLPLAAHDEGERGAIYPFQLYVYALPNLVSLSSPNLPWLNDIAGAYMFEKWRTWVELHPETAKKLGLAERDSVEVRTRKGSLVLPVKIFAGIIPEVIAIPFGFGHRSGGRWCSGIGENPAELVEGKTDLLSGAALWTSTWASIKKS